MKKWTFLAVAGLLAGAAPVFTGCIDNDEPEGISILRGAKAELLKAKAAVEQANAQWVLAQAEYVAAQTRWQLAQAEYEENRAKLLALEVEIQAARNEAEKLRLEQQMELIRQEMEENALVHETEMIKLQGLKARAQANYEVLLKQIEIAKALGSEDGVVSIASLEAKVKKAYAILYGGTYEELVLVGKDESGDKHEFGNNLDSEGNVTSSWTSVTIGEATYYYESKTFIVCTSTDEYDKLQDKTNASVALDAKLYEAEKALYNAELDKAQGNQFDEDDNGQSFIDLLTAKKNLAEYEVSVAQETLDALNAFISGDPASTDWKAELEKIAEEIDALEEKIDDANLAYEDQKNSPEYIEKWQKVYGVFSFGSNASEDDKEKYSPNGDFDGEDYINLGTDVTLVANGTKKDIIDAEAELNDAANEKKMTIEASEKIAVTAGIQNLGIKYEDPDDENKTLSLGTEISYSEFKDYQYTVDNNGELKLADDVERQQKTLENQLEAISNAVIDDNDLENAKYNLASAEKAAEDQLKVATAAKTNWEIALNASKGTYATVDATAFNKMVNDYNALYSAVSSAVSAYNKKYDAVYDAAYEEAKAEATDEKELELISNALGGKVSYLTTCPTLDVNKAQQLWASTVTLEGNAAPDKLLNIFVSSSNAATTEDKQKEAQAALGLTNNYVNKELIDTDVVEQIENAAVTAANDAITESKKDKGELNAAQQTLDEADEAIVEYVVTDGTVQKALAAYYDLAKNPYGYKATKKSSVETLLQGADKNYNPNKYYADDAKNAGKYVVLNSSIEPAEVTAATTGAIAKDQATAEDAWKANSVKAFGESKYYNNNYWASSTVPSQAYMEGRVEAWNKENPNAEITLETLGEYGKYYAAEVQVAAIESTINAKDDLAALKTAVEKLLGEFNTAIENNYNEAFSAELKAIADAEAADKEAVAALEKADAELEASNVELAKLQAQLDGRNAVMEAIADAITDSFGVVYDYDDNGNVQKEGDGTGLKDKEFTWNTESVDKFLKSLEEAAVKQELNVAAKKQALAVAEVALQKAQDGKYDIVAEKTRLRDIAKAEFDAANEAYGQALANLQTALEIMADNAAE